jgi:hypothetical protein
MSATSTWPCSNSPIWSMLVKMFTWAVANWGSHGETRNPTGGRWRFL